MALDAIGVISSLLGIISFAEDNFAPQDTTGSTVRLTVGLDAADGNYGLTGGGGDLPDIRLFNENGEFLGIVADPGGIQSGTFQDIKINHNFNSAQQATYALFSANNDAICLAAASITWPNDDRYAWDGSWGQKCGATWYYSNVYTSASNIKPNCTWLDGNNNQPQTGFQVHWPEFTDSDDSVRSMSAEDKENLADYLCTAGPPLKFYDYPDEDPNSITYWIPQTKRSLSNQGGPATETSYAPPTQPASAKFQARQNTPQGDKITRITSHTAGSLVVGESDEHAAEGLCGSATSAGPDFLHVKAGKFCRMSDKTLWPVCDGVDITDNCFNSDLMHLVLNGVAARDQPYNKIIDWRSGF
ncbi:hypothetical protein GGS21DRAFT_544790 [Xylaria nigripes]|nr:hypothetical protein GGS21DRAFT_544790 [Xylaria nigripes]